MNEDGGFFLRGRSDPWRRHDASLERESPAREEVRRASDPDRQLGGGGLPIPRWNWEEECSIDNQIIMLRCSIFKAGNGFFSSDKNTMCGIGVMRKVLVFPAICARLEAERRATP
ncbi:hypothetical protein [Sinorhizobium medicae]|uniref:hypothetical protein n=1 Tax=Sinorhizobium medicae TaxID=110321 RepID=UPI000FDBE8F5|nr:hypothetical protein [Sinorhizobium medicae]RVJ85155.1 hypothetical protein CN168_00290 [Sinorhizobium medicae]